MSYEGYSNYYCENGHYIKLVSDPGHSPDFDKCPHCGVNRFVFDRVDLTNGCDENCDTSKEDNPCPAHEKKLKIKEYLKEDCSVCVGLGSVKPIRFKMINCDCKGEDKACKKCFGTGHDYILDEEFRPIYEIHCINCKGSGKEFIPVYDLTPLLINQEPREIDINPFDSRMAEDHINYKVD